MKNNFKDFYFLLFILFLSVNCSPKINTIPPTSVQGVLNLDKTNESSLNQTKLWDFEKDGILKLDGEWEFYWGQFLNYEDFYPRNISQQENKLVRKNSEQTFKNPNYIKVPAAWNGQIFKSDIDSKPNKIDGEGFATYRILLRSNNFNGLSLKIPYINTAYKLYINEKLINEVGQIGNSPETSKPDLKSVVIVIPEKSQTLEIIFQISNFHHNKGGIRNSIRIGTHRDIQILREKNLFFDSFLCGSLLIIGFYHLGLYSLRRKENSTLWFGIICLLGTLRVLLTSENYFYNLFPKFPYELGIKLEYFTFCFGASILVSYIDKVFPDNSFKMIKRSIKGFSYLLSLCIIIFPVNFFSKILFLMEAMLFITMLYISIVLIKSIYKKSEGAKSFSLGFLIFLIAIVNDILYSNQIIFTGYLGPFGLFLFIFSQAYLLSTRSAKAFHQVEELTENLEQKVIDRTKELETSISIVENERKKSDKLLQNIRKDLQVARNIQHAILPEKLCNPDINIHTYYSPMTEVGGDIYHIEEIRPGYIRVFIADATGHGMQAALITMCILTDYHHIKEFELNPSEILHMINRQFYFRYNFLNNYFTCMIMDIDLNKQKLIYSSAGHPTQIILKDEKLNLTLRTGRLIGISENSEYNSIEMNLNKGDKIFLFTDGLFEEFNSSKEEFGEDKIYEIIKKNSSNSAPAIMDEILLNMEIFLGSKEKQDDITFLGIEYLK